MITEACFVLPRDVVTIPLRDVPLATRRHIGGEDDDVAVIRPGLRTPTRVVDAGTAALLGEFRSPSRIVDAIVRFSRAHDLDPATTLDEAFDALCTFANAGLLVSAESDATQPITASFGAGASIAGYEIRRAVQILEDTELYEARDGAGRAVAVKIARPNPSDLTRHMLDHEASVLRRLDGLACPRVVARGTFDRRPFLATEWC